MIRFEQDRRLSRATLILEGRRLTISMEALGLQSVRTINIATLNPNCEQIRRPRANLLIVPIVFTAIMCFLTYLAFQQNAIAKSIAVAPIVGLISSIWYVLIGCVPIESTIFRDYNGNHVIEIFCPKGRRFDYKNIVKYIVNECEMNARISAGSTPRLSG